jgi:hypothetical protein
MEGCYADSPDLVPWLKTTTVLRMDQGDAACENKPEARTGKELPQMPDNNHATKQDLLELEERLVERMRDMQTEVLRAFHNWARPAEVKFRSHEERLTLLEERISDIERGRGKR